MKSKKVTKKKPLGKKPKKKSGIKAKVRKNVTDYPPEVK